jgi:hypothetical protein
MRTLVLLLLLANLTLFLYTKLDSLGSGEAVRLSQQVQPDKITLLSPQQVAGPTKAATLADICVEWGPLSDSDKARALSSLEPLDLTRLISQKKVEVVTNYWVFIPPAANRAAADRRMAELKDSGVKDLLLIDSGPQRFAISLGAFQTEAAAQARLDALAPQGVKTAKIGARAQAIVQTDLVVRDPPAPAVARLKELQAGFPGTDIKIGSCDKTA